MSAKSRVDKRRIVDACLIEFGEEDIGWLNAQPGILDSTVEPGGCGVDKVVIVADTRARQRILSAAILVFKLEMSEAEDEAFVMDELNERNA